MSDELENTSYTQWLNSINNPQMISPFAAYQAGAAYQRSLDKIQSENVIGYLVSGMGTVTLQYKHYPEWARNDSSLTVTPLVAKL